MGKATIVSALGDGQYTIRIEYDERRINAEIRRLESRIAAITSDEPSAKLRKASLRKRKEKLQAAKKEEIIKAWCADLTDDLTGEVGTAEVARDKEQNLIIVPGYEGNAVYNAGRDGQLQSPLSSTAFQSYLNLCLFPAAQRWAPRYRAGIIESLSGDSATVRLDTISSRVRQITIDPVFTLRGVPISYMDCDGDAFEEGDHVLIRFKGGSWDAPEIIGFVDNPQSCGGPCYLVGEITEITGDPSVTRYVGAIQSMDQRIKIKDTTRDFENVRCIQSDWIDWQVGDPVVAVHVQNCEAKPHCIDPGYVRHAGVLFDLINQLRKDVGVDPVYMNARLNEAAKAQAEWMAETLYIGHDGRGGSTAEERIIDDAEFASRADGNWVVGENVGIAIDAEQMFQLWMESPGHYANMIRDTYEEIGLAVVLITKSGPVNHYLLGTLGDIQAGTQYAWANTFGWVDPPYWHIIPMDRIADDG